ncbi:AT-rich interactive domain-containing protein 4-like, partial [Trifolium medium]|nr:AT-rich interactive domain-containing protein 4-like [Trifolium medium]
ILRQLAPDVSYRSLVALGIASIQGLPVASFEKDDAERLLFFYQSSEKDGCENGNLVFSKPPVWLKPPPPTRKRCESSQEDSPDLHDGVFAGQGAVKNVDEEDKDRKMVNGVSTPLTPARQRLKVSAMRPIPH